jgi:putative methyltransferase (TIGR04325 family)
MRRDLSQLARRVYQKARRTARRSPHWRGTYATSTDVPRKGPGFDGDAWIAATRELTQQVATEARGTDPLLASVVALAPITGRPIRVLDFGGGMGIGYLRLRNALARSTVLDYVIVEGERVCAEGRTLLGDRSDVSFRATLPDVAESFDIVYACSAVQYVDPYAELLAQFTAYKPSSVLLADVPAGPFDSFWTSQLTVPGSVIPYHFISETELVDVMADLGYRLAVRTCSERVLETDALPRERRLDRTRNLVFVR